MSQSTGGGQRIGAKRREARDAIALNLMDDSHAPVASAELELDWIDALSPTAKAALSAYLAAPQPEPPAGLREAIAALPVSKRHSDDWIERAAVYRLIEGAT